MGLSERGSAARTLRGHVARRWRGKLPLPLSFWVNNVALSVPAGLAVGALAAWIALRGGWLRGGSTVPLTAWPMLVRLNGWCVVGAWRAPPAPAKAPAR